MLVKDVMDQKSARIGVSCTFQQAAELLVLTQASDLIVVDNKGFFKGVVSEGDIIRALIPDYNEVAKSGGSIADVFSIFIQNGSSLCSQSISRLIISQAITVSPNDALMSVASIMIQKKIRRLPVLDNGIFCGTISRADVIWAVLCQNQGKS